jgi:dihydrofolate synthase/folylpolyglutamate synthase
MVLDVAHNPAGAWALRSALSETFPEREMIYVFAAMRDKPLQELAEILFPMAEHVVVTQVANPRAATTSELLQAAARTGAAIYSEENLAAALAHARELGKPEGVLVVTGSIFLVGEAMTLMGLQV